MITKHQEDAMSHVAESMPATTLGPASVRWDGRELDVDSGCLRRRWRLVPGGLATVAVSFEGHEPITVTPSIPDWQLPGGLPMGGCEVSACTIEHADDDGFTSKHVRVRVHLSYSEARVAACFELWVWPGLAGLRSQLVLRALDGYQSSAAHDAVTVERLPLTGPADRARAMGYYCQTQQRNALATPLLRIEDIPTTGTCDWASLAAVEQAGLGLALLKESNKCVNQTAHDSGGFVLGHKSLDATGWGLLATEIVPERERLAWAHCTLAYDARQEDGLDHAVRHFIATRFPCDPARDVYVLSNTWGSTAHSRDARNAASEDAVLRELDAAAEVGVDVVQIDDGWQVGFDSNTWTPEPERGWRPHPQPYPNGWGVVRQRAEALGLRLGLWCAGMPVPVADLQWNREHGGFTHYKLDFMHLSDHARFEALRDKARAFITHSEHAVRINWDVTEIEPRVGYFSLREYGCLYLANRKPCEPASTLYRPHTVLRDAWELARFQRLQDIQLTVQNPERTMRHASDAYRHSQAYCLAIALFGTPVLFQQLQLQTPSGRRELRALLDVYRPHRLAIFGGEVEPIGAPPSNASHTGLHCHVDGRVDGRSGYLLLFRELENPEPEARFRVASLRGCRLALEDLLDHTNRAVAIGADGMLTLPIAQAPDFRFLRYTILA